MKRKATPQTHEYNREPVVENGRGEDAIETARQRYAKHRDKPTTAAADPSLRLPEALKQVDPQAISQVLPQMYSKLSMVRNLMRTFNSRNGGGSAASNTSPQGYLKTSIVNVLEGALCVLVQEHGYFEVLNEFFDCLAEDRYLQLSTEFQEVVFESIINLIKKAEEFGQENIPVSTIPAVTYGSSVPTPLYTSIDQIPNQYIKQYYPEELDEYPGYIEYVGPDGDSIYVRRRTVDYPFPTVDEEIYTLAEYAMAEELSPYIEDTNLTVVILNTLLIRYCVRITEEVMENTAGKGSSNASNLLSMLTSFAGTAGTMAQSTKTNHLPQSVLDVTSMSNTLEEHRKLIGKIKMMKQHSQTAFNLPSLLNSNITSLLTSSLSGRNRSTASLVQNIVSRLT